MQRKIFISGKITGDPDYRAKFEKAEKELEARGYIVLNPATLPDGMERGDYMQICLAMIDVADDVAFLPDYEDSEGAMVEYRYAIYAKRKGVKMIRW